MHPLQRQIDAVRQQAKSVLLRYGLGRVVAITLLTLIGVGLVDGWLKFHDPGLRLIGTGTIVAACVWSVYAYLWPALRYRPSNVALAQGVEQVRPALRGRLASAVEFLGQDEDEEVHGSVALRRAVIAHTTSDIAELQLSSAINRRPAQRSLRLAGLVVLLGLGIVIWQRGNVLLSLQRLALPFGNTSWPTTNHLVFVQPAEPLRIARGQSLDFLVLDEHGTLPEDVRVEFRYLDGDHQTGTDSLKMQLETRTIARDEHGVYRLLDSEAATDAERHWVMAAHKENIQRRFQYRASGGDDDLMAWRTVEVLEPPRIESLAITVTPPAYTQQPSRSSEPAIRAMADSTLSIQALANKRLRSATLFRENRPPVPAHLNSDARSFVVPADPAVPLVIDSSGAYWFELVDEDGITAGTEQRYEIRSQADEKPTVVIEQPATDQFVTADAEIPLRILAKDDLALQSISLHYVVSGDGQERELPLFTAERVPTIKPGENGESRLVQHTWSLKELGLKTPGTITLTAVAQDFKPQATRSAARKLTLVSARELEERLTQRQQHILSEFARALKMQQEARAQTTALEIQLRDVGQLANGDIDRLQGVELNQRQIARTLTSPAEGVTALIEALLGDLRTNRVDSPDMQRRLESLLADLQKLGRGALPTIQRELTSAVKSAQATPDGKDRTLAAALPLAGTQQDHVIATLERWLGDLKQFDNYRRFARELGLQRRDQAQIAADTEQLRTALQGREASPQEQADLRKIAERQTELSRRFDKVLQQMDTMQAQLRDTEPLAAETIGDAVASARQQALSNQMNESGRQVAGQRLNEARRSQQEIDEGLQAVIDILSDQRERELSRLVKKLREAEQELTGLRQKQAGLRKKLEAAAANTNPEERQRELQRLAREEAEIQKQIERFARRLQRLQAEDAAKKAAQGGSQAGKAGQTGESGDGAGAGKHAAAAEKDLEDAQQQLAQRRQQAEIDLAQEEVAKLETALKSLHERQQQVIADTVRLAKLKDEQQRLTRSQAESVQELAHGQEMLRDETRSLSEKLSAAEVFTLALSGAAADMQRAVEMLDRREIGPPAQQAENEALERLAQILTALEPDEAAGSEPAGNDPGNGGSGQGAGQDSIHNLAELKLLKLMQLDVNARTKHLDEKLSAKKQLTADEQKEYVELAKRQGRLADILRKLTQPTESDPEKNPQKLPGPNSDDNGLLPDK